MAQPYILAKRSRMGHWGQRRWKEYYLKNMERTLDDVHSVQDEGLIQLATERLAKRAKHINMGLVK